MIPIIDVQNSLKALALTQKPLITAASAVSPTARFEPGQQYQANVLAQLAPGIYKVQVADQTLQLQLPTSIRTGDTISLQVVSLLPRLTFTMAASANPLSTSDQLSTTARLLSSLSQQPLGKRDVQLSNTTPLWTGETPFPDTTELAGKLHNALSQSGLFYESHQAQWIAGSRNTAQLMQEPQNFPAQKHSAATGPDEGSNRTSATAVASGQERSAIPGIPDHLLPLVQQQLNALENRQVQWQGQVWAEQQMDWKIRDESQRESGGEGEGRLWMTQIHLNLPNLGEVTATLRFGDAGVSLLLEAAEDKTRAKLGSASSELVSTMSDRGISIISARVNQHDNS